MTIGEGKSLLIVRRNLSFDRDYTRIPNAWVRDARLSLRAKGLIAQLLSHQEGWQLSVQSLATANGCGRDAIRAAVQELEQAGYLRRSQIRADNGAFDATIWETCEPSPENPSPAEPSPVNPTPKKNNEKKTNEKKSIDDFFELFWGIYPRKVGKLAARKIFDRMQLDTAAEVIEGAKRFAADPNLPETMFIPHPATWLNRGGWLDEPLPARDKGPNGRKLTAEGPGKRDWVKALHDAGEHFACLSGEYGCK